MTLTRSFRETVRERVQRDAKFRDALLREALTALVDGDLAAGKMILRDYINATEGFAAMSKATGIPVKSLMRMLGPTGNPRAENLFAVVRHLRRTAGLEVEVRQRRAAA